MHPPKQKKILPLHLFGINQRKRTLFFKKIFKNIFRMIKAAFVLSSEKVLSLILTSNSHLGIAILKK